jgi:short-subunit dehydrogenase
LKLIGTEKRGTVVTVGSHSAFMDLPGHSSYINSKVASLNFTHFIGLENPNVTSITMHPGVIDTAMVPDDSFFKPYSGDSVTLAGATIAWLSSEEARWLTGRYVLASWDMAELSARKEEILRNNELVLGLRAKLGAENYK